MNEARFKQFIIYMIDLHNLHIENQVDLAANPLNMKRQEYITNYSDKKDFETLDSNFQALVIGANEKQSESIEKKKEKFEECFETKSNGELYCKFCPGVYKREGHMRNHLQSKHMKIFDIKCLCGKVFPDSTRLSRHKKTCGK